MTFYDWYGWLGNTAWPQPTDLFDKPYSEDIFHNPTPGSGIQNQDIYEQGGWGSESLDQGLAGLVPLNNDGTVVTGLAMAPSVGMSPPKHFTPYVLSVAVNSAVKTARPGPNLDIADCMVPISDPDWQVIQPNDTDGGSLLLISIVGSTNSYGSDGNGTGDSPYLDSSRSPDFHLLSAYIGPAQDPYSFYTFNPVAAIGWIQTKPHDTSPVLLYLRNSVASSQIQDYVSAVAWAIDLPPGVVFQGIRPEDINHGEAVGGNEVFGGLDALMDAISTVHSSSMDHSSHIWGPGKIFTGGPWSWFPGAIGTQWFPWAIRIQFAGEGIWQRHEGKWICVPIQPRVAGEWVDPAGLHMMQGGKWVDVGCTPGDVHS